MPSNHPADCQPSASEPDLERKIMQLENMQ